MSSSVATSGSRTERRKRETRLRLLDAALGAFVRRGFDATTTGEIAAAADLGAGTFYLHFRDKRDVYEALARRAAKDMTERWHQQLRRGMSPGDYVALALEIASEFWSEDRDRARLLLEGGPSLGSESHWMLVEDVAGLIRRDVSPSGGPTPRVLATLMLGMAIELGRVIVGADSAAQSRETVAGMIALFRRTLSKSV